MAAWSSHLGRRASDTGDSCFDTPSAFLRTPSILRRLAFTSNLITTATVACMASRQPVGVGKGGRNINRSGSFKGARVVHLILVRYEAQIQKVHRVGYMKES